MQGSLPSEWRQDASTSSWYIDRIYGRARARETREASDRDARHGTGTVLVLSRLGGGSLLLAHVLAYAGLRVADSCIGAAA